MSCREELGKGRFHFRFGKRVDKWRHEGLSPVSVLRGAGVQGGHSLRTEYQWRVSVFCEMGEVGKTRVKNWAASTVLRRARASSLWFMKRKQHGG